MAKGLLPEDVKVILVNEGIVADVQVLFGIAKKSVHLEPIFDVEDTDYLDSFTEEQKKEFILDVIFESRHYGVAEHLNYTFEIYGVSRTMTHQAVRNRIASFLESSLRYINIPKKGLNYVVPKTILDSEELKAEYQKDMDYIESLNKKWYDKGLAKGLSVDRSKELARSILPHSTATGYVFSMNLASILRLLEKRCCVRAEDEYREIAEHIRNIMSVTIPWMAHKFGPHCKMYGMCPEGKRSCGKAPGYDTVMNCYKKNKSVQLNFKEM